MPRLMSFAKTLRPMRDGSKDVTRRHGWGDLEPGDVVEAIEWSPRVGARWVCRWCCWLGGTGDSPPGQEPEAAVAVCPSCELHGLERREPERLGRLRIVSVRLERLGEITPDEVRREGFPGLGTAAFLRLFCAPKPIDPGRYVTRVEFERV